MVSLRHLLSVSSVASAVLAFVAFAGPATAKADTYIISFLNSDQGYHFYGMDDSGHVVLNNPGCGISGCWLNYLDGSFVNTVFSAPSITADNGTPCTPSVPAGGSVIHGVCNNGRDAFTGFLSSGQVLPSIYVGPAFQNLPYRGDGLLYMNSLGDIVFDDVFNEAWYEAIPATTPEPAGLLLLATGALGIAALAARRRLATLA